MQTSRALLASDAQASLSIRYCMPACFFAIAWPSLVIGMVIGACGAIGEVICATVGAATATPAPSIKAIINRDMVFLWISVRWGRPCRRHDAPSTASVAARAHARPRWRGVDASCDGGGLPRT